MKRTAPRAAVIAAALTAGAGMANAQSACGTSYAIEPGDTLYQVSQRCDVGLTRIMELNPNINARDLSVGQSVRLTVGTRAGGETETDYGNGTRRGAETYRVGQGETLYSIAQAVGVSIIELLNANGDIDPADLRVGEVIDIPTDTPSAAVRITPESGPPETQVTLRARNLRPDDWVTIGVGRVSSEWRAMGQARANGEGNLSAQVGLPDWADPGDDLIYVLDTDRGMTLKSGRFEVTGRDRDRDTGGGNDRITLEGRVSQGAECATLTTDDGDTWSLTSADIDFTSGEYVRVSGTRADMSYCQQGIGTVEVARLNEVAPENGDRNEGRDGDDGRDERGNDMLTLEGRVGEGAECATLTTSDGDVWSLTSADVDFTAGEYVRVRGARKAAAFCQQGLGTVEVTRLTEIDRGGGDGGEGDAPRNDRVTLEGRVQQGVECMVLRTSDGDTWSLTSDDVRFTEGEYVEVSGTRADMSFCQQGTGTVDVNRIREVPS
ncbi:MAG: DUF5818 domain-containing protein [Roseovarius sp.]|uniref:DUF5818 domain-containing protein n=1 Tax=Roseovarius sp. TaxID=1486281 RepID=UPI0032EF3F61